MATKYAKCPSAFVYEKPDAKGKKIRELLWGDWVRLDSEPENGWIKVHVRGQIESVKEGDKWVRRNREGWMMESDLQDERVLEIYFVDIGQGDGCFVIAPFGSKTRFLAIDAGEHDNLLRFLRWKFNTRNPKNVPIKIRDTIITHSDSDHYQGFSYLFNSDNFEFENVWHNGLVERVGDDLLGAIEDGYQVEVISTRAQLNKIINDPAKVGRKLYPNLMKKAAERGAKIRMLCVEDKFLPGYEDDKNLTIRVLAPVPEKTGQGKRKLKRFDSNDGKTKNGHSIVLRLEYGKVRILLGGDLNIPAENYLLKHYTGINPKNATDAQKKQIVEKARKVFSADAAKACHHGSGDFTTLFLQAVNAAITVVSSGDDESYAHPRPESIGCLGKYGRGNRPLIYSTELARSAKETVKNPSEIRKEIDRMAEIQQTSDEPNVKEKIEKLKEDLKRKIERTVTVYGMINLRTDGENIVVAQRLEQKLAKKASKNLKDWDFCLLKPNAEGILEYVSKHED